MRLPQEVQTHHTAWIRFPEHRPVAVRYARGDDRIFCFADAGLAELADGQRVVVAIHDLHDGPPLLKMAAVVHDVPAPQVDREVLLSLLEHVSLGRDLDEVERHLDAQRTRRMLALEAVEEL